MMVIYGASSLLGSAVNVAGNVASTGVTVGATMDRSGADGSMASALTQRVHGAIASATSEASSPHRRKLKSARRADTAARNVARASWFSFAALIVGAIIAIPCTQARRHVPAIGPSSLLDDRHIPKRTMLHNQFEDDLKHLEQIVPLLASGSPLGLPYWRRRIASLSAHQDLLPNGKSRVTRLLQLFNSNDSRRNSRALFPSVRASASEWNTVSLNAITFSPTPCGRSIVSPQSQPPSCSNT